MSLDDFVTVRATSPKHGASADVHIARRGAKRALCGARILSFFTDREPAMEHWKWCALCVQKENGAIEKGRK